MKGGFSFCGLDIYNLGLEYVPDNKDTYVFKSASSSIDEEVFNGHDGGYFYGSSLKPKEFSLKCYYEDKDVRHGLMSNIYNFFKPGKTGKLVFQKRPWCWYVATVTNVDTDSMLNYRNGFITIKLKAYYPYSRSDSNYFEEWDAERYELLRNTAFLTDESMVPQTKFEDVFDNKTDFILLNGGNAKANVCVEIAGDVGEGVIIKNNTNGSEMKIVALNNLSLSGGSLFIDSFTGKVFIKNDNETKDAFLYHEYGFIDLDPGFPINRDVTIEAESGSNIVSYVDNFIFDVTDKYIYIADKWYKIKEFNDDTLTLVENVNTSFSGNTCIVSMNELSIYPVSEKDEGDNMSITKINFIYNPTFD